MLLVSLALLNDFDILYMRKLEGMAATRTPDARSRNAPGRESKVLLYNCWKPAPGLKCSWSQFYKGIKM